MPTLVTHLIPGIDLKRSFLALKNVCINTFFISASLGFVGGAYATSQTSSYTLPYVYSPIVSQTPSSIISTMGAPGSKGGGADCNKASYGEGKPSDGGDGGTGLSFVNSLSLPSYSIGSVTSPVPTTAIYTYTLGGTGGVGGDGKSCYSGYGGGKGGMGGAITFTTPGSSMALQTAAIVVLSQGGQGGNGGPTSSTLDAGDGGRGGDGGALNITNNYSITTYGVPPPATPSETTPTYNAFGIFAQSTGGGAGDGGKNSNNVGGSGGSSKPGGAGGDVTIVNKGNISTQYGYALVGMSAGGYGGNGGNSSGFVASPNSVAGFGGNGGTVSITNSGSLQTNAASQHALIGVSIGGGGGVAGSSAALMALGGSGGDGANGGAVNIVNSGTIQTQSIQSIGVAAISIGGGGGMGGLSSNAVVGGSGGDGGGGGDGGTVTVKNTGSICTGGGCSANSAYVPPAGGSDSGNSAAVVALSIGGGGGVGGYSKSVGFPLSVAVGGSGGDGGKGGSVWVSNSDILKTTEVSSPGVLAASVGGGGGQGGGALSVAAGGLTPTMSMSYGGSGGDGGNAGTVGINCGQPNSGSTTACGNGPPSYTAPSSNALVTTYGSSSPAFHALSVGGGGGAGGFSVALAADVLLATSLSVGGSGGKGGDGGAVYAGTGGVRTITYGSNSSGIEAQSIGGGGGRGGMTLELANYVPGASAATVSGSISVGGSGGDGGKAGAVLAENIGNSITTYGSRADGIYAASIGGRGGRAALSSEASAGLVLEMSTSIGGAGGSGNTGGSVTVNNTGSTSAINVYGNDSHAIQALSIGGGGGAGGLSAAGGVSLAATSSYSVGGTGGSGGNSGAVNVKNEGIIGVYGNKGTGILALSVGGGGGNGGSSVSGDASLAGAFSTTTGGQGEGGATAGTVTVNNSGAIFGGTTTAPSLATHGISAMSIGGGGGHGGLAVSGAVTLFPMFSVSMADTVGGGAGDGGTGNTVSVTNSGKIILFGDMSTGITATSLGGRGGMGGIAIGGSVSIGVPLSVTTGADGGDGGVAGSSSVTNYSEISTFGFRANGITAQSIGGSGGTGGMSIGVSASADLVASSTISLGGDGGKGGVAKGAAVNNESGASILTYGPFSSGLVAQSIGGSGGIGGIGIGESDTFIAPSQTLGGDGGRGAVAGWAQVNSYGTVTTQGANSVGILAQSIGGNGGNSGYTKAGPSSDRGGVLHITSGDTAGGGATGSTASASVTGTVLTYGALSTGIALESIGGGGGRAGATINDSPVSILNRDSSVGLFNLGATGGAGGDGGTVSLSQSGKVITGGSQSDAIYGGSIGGGGGSAGLSYKDHSIGSKTFNLTLAGNSGSSGSGGEVVLYVNSSKPITSDYSIYTTGAGSDAVFAQSIGGGGGAASGFHFQNTAGGSFASQSQLGSIGSSGGNGGDIEIYTGGEIQASGVGSTAILAQSIGGGGGKSVSGLVVTTYAASTVAGQITQLTTGDGTVPSPNISVSTSGAATSINPIAGTQAQTYGAFNLGANSSVAGAGGDIIINSSSKNVTNNNASDGIKAQSIGGGGGYSSLIDQYSTSPFAAAAMYLGGHSSHGGDGGKVTINQLLTTETSSTDGDISTAILAQSIGGGGGDARQVSQATVGVTSSFASQLGVTAGATGGRALNVVVNNNGGLWTGGSGSDAIVAQSVGGGGGFSAMTGIASNPLSFTSAQTHGNSKAGQNIPTSITDSSVSTAYAGRVGTSVITVRGASFAAVLGASGATDNSGGDVGVNNASGLSTGGDYGKSGNGSMAIIAQSIGAGGGISRQHLTNFDQSQTSVAMMLGGFGESNGNGANVTVTNNYASSQSGWWINTNTGSGSVAILAQSIGGGGGLGMFTASTTGKGGSANLSIALGGTDNSNGESGFVTVNAGGHIQTSGAQSEAIIAQSISGGGGVAKVVIDAASAGAFASTGNPLSVSSSSTNVSASAINGLSIGARMGANSTDNGNAGNVAVNSSAAISTYGDMSKGIVAQSIGNGGGIVDVTAINLNTGDFMASVNMGGSAPGTIGNVAVTTTNTMITTGNNLADGILAQSISYGGGSFAVVDWGATFGGGTLNYLLGSPGMVSSPDANSVTVRTGSIITGGYGSSAITAQSIGGGGGLLGFIVNTSSTGMYGSGALGSQGSTDHSSAGGDVSVTANFYLYTSGAYAPGIIAQSIGGGGGRVVGNQGQNTTTLLIGGQGGGGGGHTVDVTTDQPAYISTHGANSPGIIAQSIGGGGGIINTANVPGARALLGGVSASAGTVNVTANGNIWTGANGSAGIIAQSIGGGGGLVTINGVPTFGAANTTGSNGGSVNVTVNGGINTNGTSAPGVLATSIGGGGGVAVLSDGPNQGHGIVNGRGDGGAVTVDVNSNIVTYGSGSDGVVAVSIGAGGGVIISSGSTVAFGSTGGNGGGGHVKVNNHSSISTHGPNTVAIYAKSVSGNQDPEVNMYAGSSAIGGPGGIGIFMAGAINNLTNGGYIGTADGISGRAIVAADIGTTTINNSGTTMGDITLGGSGNVINNLAAGRMYLRSHPDMGADGIFYNSGFLQFNPQGLSGLGALAHTGTLIQLGGGVLGIQYDHQAAATHQALVASSISAGVGSRLELGGSISPTLIHAGLIAPGSTGLSTIISNNGGTLIHNDLGVVNTAIMTYGLVKDSSGVQLSSTANFVPTGLSAFGNQMGSAIGTNQTAGSNAFFQAATAQLVTVPTVGALDQAYSNLAGSAIQAMPQANYQAVTRAIGTVSDRMNSWRVGDSFIATTKNPRALMTGAASMNQPITPNAPQVANGTLPADGGQLPITSLEKSTDARTWITPFGGTSNSNNLADQIYGGSLGIEAQSDDRKFIGGAAMTISQSNYTYSSATTPATPGSATNYGAQFYFGARHESAYLSAIGYLGGSSGNFTRQLQTLGFNTTSAVNVHSNIMGARVEAGYNLLPNPQGKATLQVTPFVAIQPTQIRQNGANENFGSLGSGFYYGSNINTAVPVYLGAEISGDVVMGHNEVIKPFLRVSWAHDLMNNPMAMGAAYNSSTGPTLYANGTPSMGNMVILKGGAKYNWGTKVSAYATIDLEQGNAAYSYRGIGGSVGAIYSW